MSMPGDPLPTAVPSLEPPRGPGVAVPFAAPPTDGNRRRMWIGLSIGAVVAVLCCVGGVFGVGALVVSSAAATRDGATRTVTVYLDAWQHQRYSDAYDQLCDADRSDRTLTEFTTELTSHPPLESFTLGTPVVSTTEINVPAHLEFSGGTTADGAYQVVVDQGTNTFQVCGTG